ncbi:MAG: sulfatase [Bacteroidota bacterium]
MRNLLLPLYCLLLLVACGEPTADPAETKPRPNVLFILADDLGYHDLSCMGSRYYETPNIDRIAKEGMMFTNGYAACQVCSPSRASIMSGKFPSRHGITDWIGAKTGAEWRSKERHNKLLPPDYVHALPAAFKVLPEAMKDNGYKTFFAGKWHIGEEGSWPEDHGFDINKGGWEKGSPVGGFFAPWENPRLASGPDGENLSMRLAKETASFMQEHRDTSFFAFLSFYAVHAPIQTTQAKWKKYRDKAAAMGIEEKGFEMGRYLPIRQHQDNPVYAGLVEAMDDAVGHVLARLDSLGLADNTIVIFTSDNGGVAAGDNFATSNLPLRAGKGYQFEGGIREPFFIKAPGISKAGSSSSVPVNGTDFYPTILELAGGALLPAEHEDGLSLVPLLRGDSIASRPLFWHYPHYGNQGGEPSSIVREGRWKLIHYYEDGRNELYDLSTDISEQQNLATTQPALTTRLHDLLMNHLQSVGAKFPDPDPLYDANAEAAYLTKVRTEKMADLEARRLELLDPDFDPDNNWWGSEDSNSEQ